MFRLSTRDGETIVFSRKWSHKSVTEIIKKNYIFGSVWYKSFIQMPIKKKKRISLTTGVQIKVSKMYRLQYNVVSIFFCQGKFRLA